MEERVLQKYLDRYKNYQLFVAFSFVSTAILFTSIPLITEQFLPADAWYPFAIESRTRFFLYATQVLTIFQVGLGVAMDLIIATFFWYSAARVELLEIMVSRCTNAEQLKKCAKDYQDLIV